MATPKRRASRQPSQRTGSAAPAGQHRPNRQHRLGSTGRTGWASLSPLSAAVTFPSAALAASIAAAWPRSAMSRFCPRCGARNMTAGSRVQLIAGVLCPPGLNSSAFAEYRSAGAALCNSPRGDRAPAPMTTPPRAPLRGCRLSTARRPASIRPVPVRRIHRAARPGSPSGQGVLPGGPGHTTARWLCGWPAAVPRGHVRRRPRRCTRPAGPGPHGAA
jgi:hypothetical protein